MNPQSNNAQGGAEGEDRWVLNALQDALGSSTPAPSNPAPSNPAFAPAVPTAGDPTGYGAEPAPPPPGIAAQPGMPAPPAMYAPPQMPMAHAGQPMAAPAPPGVAMAPPPQQPHPQAQMVPQQPAQTPMQAPPQQHAAAPPQAPAPAPAQMAPPAQAAPPQQMAPPAAPPVAPPAPQAPAPATVDELEQAAMAPPASFDENERLRQVKDRAYQQLFDRMGARLYEKDTDADELHQFVMSELDGVLAAEDASLSDVERQRMAGEIADDVLGHGPCEQFLRDESVSEIMVCGTDQLFIERNGKLVDSGERFQTEEHLRQVIERIVGRIGRRIDESSPMVDARLADGSRVNAIIPPLAVDGSALTIRKFKTDPLTVDDLIRFKSFTPEVAQLLQACVEGALNILVSGGTGTGKTTLLNVLSSFIPAEDRIVTIEDSVELQLRQEHVIRLESRPPNIEGKGAVTIRDLVKNSLRMRPDRIVVGECRAGETLDMLQAMNTGHDGSLSTLHANTPRDALSRTETMVLMAGMDLPIKAIREQIASAVDLIIQATRLRDGTRRITQITEIVGMEGDIITLSDIFKFDYEAGVDAEGKFLGSLKPTGIRPKFIDQLEDYGISVPSAVFGGGGFS